MENQNKKCPAGSSLNLNCAYTINIRITGVMTPSCDPTNSAKLMIDMLNPSDISPDLPYALQLPNHY